MGVAHTRKFVVLPGGWPKTVKSAILHAISLAFNAMTIAYGNVPALASPGPVTFIPAEWTDTLPPGYQSERNLDP